MNEYDYNRMNQYNRQIEVLPNKEYYKITKKIVWEGNEPILAHYKDESGSKFYLDQAGLDMFFDEFDVHYLRGSIVFWEKQGGIKKSKILLLPNVEWFVRSGIFGLVRRDNLIIAKLKIRNR